jgi:hypothetical protein
MRCYISCLAAALTLAGPVLPATTARASTTSALPVAPLIVDGNFAGPSDSSNPVLVAGEHLLNWTVGGGGVQVQAAGSQQPPPGTTQSLVLGNYNYGGAAAQGSVSQVVKTTPGWSYLLRWYQAGAGPGCGPVVRTLDVAWNGVVVATRTFDTAGRSSTKMGWAHRGAVVTASKTSTVISFADATPNLPHGCAPSAASAIGEVSLWGDAVLYLPTSATLPPAGALTAVVRTAAGTPLNYPALTVKLYGAIKQVSYAPPVVELLATGAVANGEVALHLRLPSSQAGKTFSAYATLSGPNYLSVTRRLTIKVS